MNFNLAAFLMVICATVATYAFISNDDAMSRCIAHGHSFDTCFSGINR